MLRGGGHPVRGRAGRHRGRRGARLRRHPGHPPRARQRRGVRHRPRGPGQARVGDRLAGARPLPGHARLLHGRPHAAADRRAAGRRGAARRRAGGGRSSAGRSPASARCSRRSPTSPSAPRRRGSARRRSRSSARSPRCASSSPGSRPARCTAARSRSRARVRRRARWPPGCARSARRSSRRRRSGSSRSTRRSRRCAATTSCASPRPTAPSCLLDRLRDARELAGVTVAAIGPGTAARAARRAASSPTSCPSARSPRGWWRRSPDVARRARAGRPRRRGARRAAGRAPRARRAGRRRRALRDGRRAARRRRPARRPRRADYLLFTSASSVRFFVAAAGAEALRGPRLGVDRPGHQRRAARARRRAGPRGRPAHARRARRRAARDARR